MWIVSENNIDDFRRLLRTLSHFFFSFSALGDTLWHFVFDMDSGGDLATEWSGSECTVPKIVVNRSWNGNRTVSAAVIVRERANGSAKIIDWKTYIKCNKIQLCFVCNSASLSLSLPPPPSLSLPPSLSFFLALQKRHRVAYCRQSYFAARLLVRNSN